MSHYFAARTLSKPNGYLLIALWAFAGNACAGAWSYVNQPDPLTNQTYSYARSPLPARGQYDNVRLEVVCKQNRLQFVVDGGSLIASQDRAFDMEYQIDRQNFIPLKMKTFPDSKQRGYTETNVPAIIDNLLGGKTVFIRVTTLIKKVLTGLIELDDAAGPVKQVVNDCGTAPQTQPAPYSLARFQEDFNRLTAEQQAIVLQKLEVMVKELK